MTLSTVKVTGTFNFPDADWADYAKAEFHISSYDTDVDVVAPDPVSVVLTAGGALDIDLWPNSYGSRGTYYRVYVHIYKDSSYTRLRKTIDFGRIQVSGNSDIQDLLDTPVTIPDNAVIGINAPQNYSGDGSTVSFILPVDPIVRANVLVFIDGIRQAHNTYNVSGTTLTFSEAPPVGTGNIQVLITSATSVDSMLASNVATNDGSDVQAELDILSTLYDNSVLRVTASEAIGADRAVTWDGYLLTSANIDNYAGITAAAAAIGENVIVYRQGIYTNTSLSLTPDEPVFAQSSGVITQVVPSLPLRRLGIAKTSDTIHLDPYPVIGAA